MKKKNEELKFVTTTVRISADTVKRMKKTAESVGMAQSSFIRYAIVTTIKRIEEGKIA